LNWLLQVYAAAVDPMKDVAERRTATITMGRRR